MSLPTLWRTLPSKIWRPMTIKNYKIEIQLDPPMEVHCPGGVERDQENNPINTAKDYVHIEATSSDKECLEWFVGFVKERAACIWEMEEVNE